MVVLIIFILILSSAVQKQTTKFYILGSAQKQATLIPNALENLWQVKLFSLRFTHCPKVDYTSLSSCLLPNSLRFTVSIFSRRLRQCRNFLLYGLPFSFINRHFSYTSHTVPLPFSHSVLLLPCLGARRLICLFVKICIRNAAQRNV